VLTAITRPPSPALRDCLLTYMQRDPIDFDHALVQHRAYEAALSDCGVRVVSLPPQPDMPDSVFVEDTAIVVDEIAVIASMGSDARRRERDTVAEALAPHREVRSLPESGRLEGGDVFRIGKRIFVGRSTRTDDEGIRSLEAVLQPFGYEVRAVDVPGCLHLTTGAAPVSPTQILINPEWVDQSAFTDIEKIQVDADEPWAGNAIRLPKSIILPTGFPKTLRRLEQAGLQVRTVDIAELMKAEAGLTCMSLIFESGA